MKRLWKLGGSLLTDPSFADRFRVLAAQQPQAENLLLVGGGQAVDLVRQWQQRFHLLDEQCHDLALAGMNFNRQLVKRLLPEFDVVSPEVFSAIEQQSQSLPRTWKLTSDSLSAWLCLQWQIPELILVKSALVSSASPDLLADQGIVDEYFPQFCSQDTRIGIVTLSQPGRSIIWLESAAT